METKFLLNENNANLWKFIKTYQRYLNKELSANEYFKFMHIMKSLKAENKQLNELIIDNNFLSFFVHYWENGLQKW